MKFYCSSAQDVIEHVQSSEAGLSTAEAQARLEKNGKNKLAEGKKYIFAVRAYLKVDSVVYWADYDKFTFGTKLPAPVLSSVKSPAKGKLTVKWSAVSGADGYQIFYKTSKKASYKKLTNTTKNPFTASVKPATYYIKVRAYSKVSGGYVHSGFSGEKTVKVK